MRRGSSRTTKMWWVIVAPPCTRKRSYNKQTESRMEIEEILKMKLATITEDEEEPVAASAEEENGGLITANKLRSSCMAKRGNNKNLDHFIVKLVNARRRIFRPQFSLKESYVIFMAGLAGKGGLHGLPRC